MQFLSADLSRFEDLPEYPFEPHFVAVGGEANEQMKMHYVDEGQGEVVLCLHGQPSWSYLYRKMIPILTEGGVRVVAPDLIGFGKSDKPTQREDYTYANHVSWVSRLVETLDLENVTLICQDWGGLIGLRVVAEHPERFARVVVANTGLPDANGIADDKVEEISAQMRGYLQQIPVANNTVEMMMAMGGDDSGMGFLHWVKFCSESPNFDIAEILNLSCGGTLSADEIRAYNAPFPDDAHKMGARQFPSLVPIMPDNPAIPANRAAWAVLGQWNKPLITAFSDSDPVTAGGQTRFEETVPGAQGQPHTIIKGAGHFLQEQAPAELANVALELIRNNPL